MKTKGIGELVPEANEVYQKLTRKTERNRPSFNVAGVRGNRKKTECVLIDGKNLHRQTFQQG